jgi:hypothetical protein
MLSKSWIVERRADGTIVVRVPPDRDPSLPDAVFAFRPGDSQYAKWDYYLRERELAEVASSSR